MNHKYLEVKKIWYPGFGTFTNRHLALLYKYTCLISSAVKLNTTLFPEYPKRIFHGTKTNDSQSYQNFTGKIIDCGLLGEQDFE